MRTRTKASFTADAACSARAHAARHADPLLRNPDYLAPRIVGMPFRMLLWPFLRAGFLEGYERRAPGVYFHHQARTKRFDAFWLDELDAGTRQFVLLGAGFDTRAARFADRLDGARVFEVDHPLTSREKQKRLRRIVGRALEHVTYVPVDFVRQSLARRLADSGFDPARRTLFLWEGVMMYLTADAVDATLAFVARTAPMSSIAFDYIYRAMLAAPTRDVKRHLDLARSKGEPYQFGVDPGDLAPLLERNGLSLESDLDADDAVARYLIGSDGRVWGRPTPCMGIAHARVAGGAPLQGKL